LHASTYRDIVTLSKCSGWWLRFKAKEEEEVVEEEEEEEQVALHRRSRQPTA